MKFLQYLLGRGESLGRISGLRFFNASTEEYSERNYANNVAEYNTVLGSLTAKRRNFSLRDVYNDMMLDGVKPTRDTFHSLVVGTMRGSRMQDAFFFIDQMKIMGLVPDVTLYNLLISTGGKCKNFDQAIQVKKMIPKLFFYPCVCKWFGDIANEFYGKHFVNQKHLR